MTYHIGVLMDPIASINPKKDSTLAMMVAARARGWKVSVFTQADLSIENSAVNVRHQVVDVSSDPASWFTVLDERQESASTFDAILMRKDPPFDMEYIYSTYLLEMIEKSGTPVLNRPGSIRDCNEKLFALQFPECCPPHVVSRDPAVLKAFHEEHQDVIYKPLDGMGGTSIFRAKPNEHNLSVIIETLTGYGTVQTMAQRYIPEISAGDTRILLINGEPVPYGLARIPSKGETRGNLAAGGAGVGRELSERDLFIARQVAPSLKERGLYFVGIDVIGDYLTEINVTCPTCIREIDAAFDLDIAADYMTFIDSEILGG